MPRISESSHYIVEHDIDEKPVSKNQVKQGLTEALAVDVRQQADIENHYHRGGQAHNHHHKDLQQTK